MEIAYATLAVAAEYTPGGKFYVLGGDIDQLNAPGQFPVVTGAPLAFATKIYVGPEECERDHPLTISFVHPDGTSSQLLFEDKIHPPRPITALNRTTVGLVIQLNHLVIPTAGIYHLRLSVGNESKVLPIIITPMGS